MIYHLSILLISFIALHYSCAKVIDVSKDIGAIIDIPHWLIAVFMLSFGTSLPEAVVTIASSIKGYPILAMGNLIGSNIANVSLALGLPWLVYGLKSYTFQKLFIFEFFAIQLLFVIVALYLNFNLVTGVLLILLYIAFILFKVRQHRNGNGDRNTSVNSTNKMSLAIKSLIAFTLIPLASHFLVQSASELINILGLSATFMGLVLLAVGTSLPEVYTCFMAIKKGLPEVAIGNVVGSNIVNSTFVAGFIGLFGVKTVSYSEFIYDFIIMMVFALLTSYILLARFRSRFFSILLLTGYIAYITSLTLS